MTLINALVASGRPDARQTGLSLAAWLDDFGFGGEVGWRALFKSCNLAILERHDEALEVLSRVNQSPRLRRNTLLLDSWCFQQYSDNPTYKTVLAEQERRRAAQRDRLPDTLAAHGVRL